MEQTSRRHHGRLVGDAADSPVRFRLAPSAKFGGDKSLLHGYDWSRVQGRLLLDMSFCTAPSALLSAQIEKTGDFQLGGGAEGKYFWEKRLDAQTFAVNVDLPYIVRAKYTRVAAAGFFRWRILDDIGPARFADQHEMNTDLLEIRTI